MKSFLNYKQLWGTVALSAALTGAPAVAVAQDSQKVTIKIDVTGGRPLADALRVLQDGVGMPINYEEITLSDPAYVKKSDLPGMKGRLVPRGGHLVTSLDVPDLPPELKAAEAARMLVGAYTNANLPGTYQVVQDNERVSIVPIASPLMDAHVTVPYADKRSVISTLKLITDALAKTIGSKVVLLTQPFQESDTVSLGANDQPAKDVIRRISDEFGGKIAYHLVYDPQIGTHFLNLVPVSASIPRTTVLSKPPLEGSRSPNNPFFVKTN